MLETDGTRYHISDEDTSFGSGPISPVPLPQELLSGSLPQDLSWHVATVSTEVTFLLSSLQDQTRSEREKVRKHRAAGSCFEAVGKWTQGALRSPRTPWGRAGKLGRMGTDSLQGEGGCGVPSSSSPSSASWLHPALLELGDGFILIFRQLVDSLTLLWFCVEDQPVYFVYFHTQTFRFGKARPSRTSAFQMKHSDSFFQNGMFNFSICLFWERRLFLHSSSFSVWQWTNSPHYSPNSSLLQTHWNRTE